MVRAVRNTTFEGIEGRLVTLNEQGDRVESYVVLNYVVEGNLTSTVPVGVYNSSSKQYSKYERDVVWPGEFSMCVDTCLAMSWLITKARI